MDTLKAEQIGATKWRVLAIPFGGPLKGKDTDGEFFSPRTDIKPDWFPKRPVIWHHGLDETVKDEDLELGVEDDLEKTDDGWWATMWLNRSNRYWSRVNKWLSQNKMFGSSGSIAHLVRTDHATGEILRWPHAEQTLTLTPANYFSRVSASKALDHFTSAGIELDPALRGLLAELDSVTNDLTSDLPSGGGDSAVSRLASQLDRLDEVIRLVS